MVQDSSYSFDPPWVRWQQVKQTFTLRESIAALLLNVKAHGGFERSSKSIQIVQGDCGEERKEMLGARIAEG